MVHSHFQERQMKLSIRSCFATVACCIISHTALAEGYSPAMQVIGMEVGDTGTLSLRLSGNTECGSPIAMVGKIQPYYKDILDLTLVAYSTGKDLRVWIASCDLQRRAVILRVALGNY
jgi:hypothetical protein